MKRRIASVTTSLVLSALIAAAANASFIPLGVVDGLKVNGNSADGSYIVGQYLDLSGDKIAMRWDITGSDPLEDLGELATGKIESEARAASGDGSVVVGDSKIEDPNDPGKDVNEAFIWEDGVMTGLGFLEDPTVKFESVATAVSDDGLVVAGQSKVTDPNNAGKGVKQAFIWEDGVMTGLGFLADDGNDYESEALGISGDGLVVVGKAKNTDPNNASKSVREAFVWEDGVMTGLGFLQDDTSQGGKRSYGSILRRKHAGGHLEGGRPERSHQEERQGSVRLGRRRDDRPRLLAGRHQQGRERGYGSFPRRNDSSRHLEGGRPKRPHQEERQGSVRLDRRFESDAQPARRARGRPSASISPGGRSTILR